MLTILLGSEGCDPWTVRVEDLGELRTWARERLADPAAVQDYVVDAVAAGVGYRRAWCDSLPGEWLGGEFCDWQVLSAELV